MVDGSREEVTIEIEGLHYYVSANMTAKQRPVDDQETEGFQTQFRRDPNA